MTLINIFCLLVVAALSVVAEEPGFFVNPSSRQFSQWTLGEEQAISWETTLDVFNISFYQQNHIVLKTPVHIYSKTDASDETTSFTWAVQLLGFDLDYSGAFFFGLDSNTSPELGFTSAYFTIIEPTAGERDAHTSSPSSTSTSLVSRTNVDFRSSRASETPDPDAGLSAGDKAALGVGFGIGLPILCGIGVLIWQRMDRSGNKKDNEELVEEAPKDWITELPKI
ncbi:hypothetical protein BJY04DRAFT_217048 [Aspergillus karnatakaensis]|uniref:uncharacterized protein n=1 Tax=Aspergillus karnatakaensis TaxID=1810916 RepID=UPI003CCE3487